MKVTVRVNDTHECPAEAGVSLLAALREAGIFLLSACGGRAACGTCRARVLEGLAAPLTPSERHWLSEADKAAGVRLACQVNVANDLRVEVPPETFDIRRYESQVVSLRDLTYDIKEVRVQLTDPAELRFKAGQFVQFKVPGAAPGEPVYRSYSMASDPRAPGELTFQVRYVPRGVCTTYVHRQMKVGDRLTIVGPWGSVWLRDSDRELLFIAGGSGMSPVRSMLLDLAGRQCARRARYFFGAKSRRDLFRIEEMREMEKRLPDFRFVPALSEPEPGDGWAGETGLITEVVDRHVAQGANADAYLCGSPMMVNSCVKVLKAKGIPDPQILFDKFV